LRHRLFNKFLIVKMAPLVQRWGVRLRALVRLFLAVFWAAGACGLTAAAGEKTNAPGERPSATPAQLRIEDLGKFSAQQMSEMLAARKPAELAEFAHSLEKLGGSEAETAITQFFNAWVEVDADAALQAALGFSNESRKETALRTMFENASPKAAARLTVGLKNAPAEAVASTLRSELLTSGIATWSEVDAATAAAFVDKNPDATNADGTNTPGAASMLVARIASSWARSDPQAAMAWAEHQSNSRSARQGAIAGWWAKDPAGAEAYALAHLGNFEDSKLAGIIANRMAVQDPKRAADWLKKLPEEARTLATIHVAVPWGHRAPKEASEWAMTLPPEQRTEALGAIASQWARKDPEAAGQWLSSLKGASRDQAIAAYADAVAATDAPTALKWTAMMSDPVMRDTVTEQVVGIWKSRDPQAARDWIERSGFTEEQKTHLLNARSGG
jgi:hypothetical protein